MKRRSFFLALFSVPAILKASIRKPTDTFHKGYVYAPYIPIIKQTNEQTNQYRI